MRDRVPITVVLCTMRSRREDLAKCLASLAAARDAARHEVIVVTGPGDDLAKEAAAVADRLRVRIARTTGNGLSLKRNLGCRLARGEIVAYVDDDATVDVRYFEALERAFGEGVECVAGALEPVFDTEPQGPLRETAFWIGGFNRWCGETRTDSWAGANCAFRRESLRAAGPFDLRLGPGGTYVPWGDDSEMFRRFSIRGTARFAPDVLVRHRIQHERVRLDYVIRRAFRSGRALAVIDRLHQRDYWRRAGTIPVLLAQAAIVRFLPGSGLEARLRLRRLVGYALQVGLLLAGRVPPCASR